MRIKEVEKTTGLTAKAIRLYESKGLLSVARENENDYRDYTPEDVERLKTIAVLRQLDVPVKTIKEWVDGKLL
jgi:DNA-binding transcriptional MerR regulator